MALTEKVTPDQNIPEALTLPSDFPTLPEDVQKRFPSIAEYQSQMEDWYRRLRGRIYEQQDTFQATTNDAINNTNDAMSAADGNLSAAIQQEAITRASADSAEATIRSTADVTLQGNINTVTASVIAEQTARIAADGQIYLKWGVALDINGRIIGRVNLDGTNQSSTFLVSSDYFQVQNAAGTVTLVDVRSAGGVIVFGADVQSDNFSAGSAGWRIQRAGNAEFNNVTVRGTIFASSGSIGGFALDIDRFYSTVGTFRVEMSSSGGYLAMKDASNGVHSEMGGYFFDIYNFYTAGQDAVKIESYITGGGYGRILLYNSGGSLAVILNSGGGGSAFFGGNIGVDGTASFMAGNFTMDFFSTFYYFRIPAAQAGRIEFANHNNYIEEYYGIRLVSEGNLWPIRIVNGGLMMNGNDELGTFNFDPGKIYWSSSVWLYESGGYLYLHDANGDRPLT